MVKYKNPKKGGSVYSRSERRDRLSTKIIIAGRLRRTSRSKLTAFYCAENSEKIDYNESRYVASLHRIDEKKTAIVHAIDEYCHGKAEIRRID